jgi:hypothetical protein
VQVANRFLIGASRVRCCVIRAAPLAQRGRERARTYDVAMLRDPPLLASYRALIESTDPHKRGRELEHLIVRLFRGARLAVERNPGAATPRQTDLVAIGAGGAMYLVETKWRTRVADISDLDSLRARITRTPGAVGVLVSISGFSASVPAEIEAHRKPEILLIDGEELEGMLAGDVELKAALRAKEDALRIHGEALLASRPGRARPRQPPHSGPTPADTHFVLSDARTVPWVKARGEFGQFTFAREVKDPDWVTGAGAGVTVDIPLEIRDVDGIVRALSELSDLAFSTGASHWSIQQAGANWHGMGGESLATALESWEERYAELDGYHHTEQVCYQDNCDDGFYTLTFDVDASARRKVWHAALSMVLIGVPLDSEPIRELCRTFKVQTAVHFRPRTARALTRTHFTRDDTIELEVLASIGGPRAVSEPDGGTRLRPQLLASPRRRSGPLSPAAMRVGLDLRRSGAPHQRGLGTRATGTAGARQRRSLGPQRVSARDVRSRTSRADSPGARRSVQCGAPSVFALARRGRAQRRWNQASSGSSPSMRSTMLTA